MSAKRTCLRKGTMCVRERTKVDDVSVRDVLSLKRTCRVREGHAESVRRTRKVDVSVMDKEVS